MTIRQKVSPSCIRSTLQPRSRATASSASRAAGTCPRAVLVKKSRSSVGCDVRCYASRAAPPARRKPLLAGVERIAWPPPAGRPTDPVGRRPPRCLPHARAGDQRRHADRTARGTTRYTAV
jgi:hypothetical protein